MRIPGLGGGSAGPCRCTPVTLPGGEIFTSLQTGAIDATSGLAHTTIWRLVYIKLPKHYYYPRAQHEPGSMMEFVINKTAFEKLPKICTSHCVWQPKLLTRTCWRNIHTRNQAALIELKDKHGVDVRAFPDDVLSKLQVLSEQVVAEVSAADPLAQKVYHSYINYRDQVKAYHAVSEQAYINARD